MAEVVRATAARSEQRRLEGCGAECTFTSQFFARSRAVVKSKRKKLVQASQLSSTANRILSASTKVRYLIPSSVFSEDTKYFHAR